MCAILVFIYECHTLSTLEWLFLLLGLRFLRTARGLIVERSAVRPLLTAGLITASAELDAVDWSTISLRFVKVSNEFKVLNNGSKNVCS